MMHSTAFHDAFSITALATIEDRLRAAARATALTEIHSERRHGRAYLAGIGHLLVRLGAWLQASATQPAMMEETVQ